LVQLHYLVHKPQVHLFSQESSERQILIEIKVQSVVLVVIAFQKELIMVVVDEERRESNVNSILVLHHEQQDECLSQVFVLRLVRKDVKCLLIIKTFQQIE